MTSKLTNDTIKLQQLISDNGTGNGEINYKKRGETLKNPLTAQLSSV
jgi:hypothetical protein